MPRLLPIPFFAAALAFLGAAPAQAQRAAAVPQLDLDKLTGTWYEIAKLPTKAEKRCLSDNTVIYALNDKANTFQVGTFCTVKRGDHTSINSTGRQDKLHDGKLQLQRLVLFHRPYWVLAADPGFEWVVVGTPNHKTLWFLSRQAHIAPELYAQLQNTANTQGFSTAKLTTVTQAQHRTTLASPSANPNQIEAPPEPTKTGSQPSSTAGKP